MDGLGGYGGPKDLERKSLDVMDTIDFRWLHVCGWLRFFVSFHAVLIEPRCFLLVFHSWC